MPLSSSLEFPRRVLEIVQFPRVEINLWGDQAAHDIYRILVRRHPRLRIIRNKCWGIALLNIPGAFAEYLTGSEKQALRTNRKKAVQQGFTFSAFDPAGKLEEIRDVNASARTRQGKHMRADYLEIPAIAHYFARVPSAWGVFDSRGVLRAYAHTPVIGDVFLFSRILGHSEYLSQGIVYLLVSEVIREMIEEKLRKGSPNWAMYDTFVGGGDGIRYFKARLGFGPMNVKWRWVGE